MLDWFSRELRRLQEVKRDERGFTLIELLVVIIIIGILAAIAIPVFLGQRERAQNAEAVSAARNAATIVQSIATECNGMYASNPPDCDTAITGGDVTAEEPSLSSANPTVTVPTSLDSFEVSVNSDSGDTATFDSTTGEVTVT
jgi:type IV pilus assembly protein PilA